jgi:hypothetical protein
LFSEDSQIAARHAYKAMFSFLEQYWETTKSDELGILLGSMSLLDDGLPADPAIWSEWLKIYSQVLGSGEPLA